jgi:hypothetical protein
MHQHCSNYYSNYARTQFVTAVVIIGACIQILQQNMIDNAHSHTDQLLLACNSSEVNSVRNTSTSS